MGWMPKGSSSSLLLLPWLATSELRRDFCRESGRNGSPGACRADLLRCVNGGGGWQVKAAAASGQSDSSSCRRHFIFVASRARMGSPAGRFMRLLPSRSLGVRVHASVVLPDETSVSRLSPSKKELRRRSAPGRPRGEGTGGLK